MKQIMDSVLEFVNQASIINYEYFYNAVPFPQNEHCIFYCGNGDFFIVYKEDYFGGVMTTTNSNPLQHDQYISKKLSIDNLILNEVLNKYLASIDSTQKFAFTPVMNIVELQSVTICKQGGSPYVEIFSIDRKEKNKPIFPEKVPISLKSKPTRLLFSAQSKNFLRKEGNRYSGDVKFSAMGMLDLMGQYQLRFLDGTHYSQVTSPSNLVEMIRFLSRFDYSINEIEKSYDELSKELSEKQIRSTRTKIQSYKENSQYPILDLKDYFIYTNYLTTEHDYTNYFMREYQRIISLRTSTSSFENAIPYPEVAQYFTIIETDKILVENGMRDYGLYEISRSTHGVIDLGEYFYAFDESDNLLMLKPPYRHVSTDTGNYIVFDSQLYQRNEVIVIPKSEIVSYKLYGTELMQSSVKTNQQANVVEVKADSSTPQYRSPSIIGTALSGFLFGSSYTILNGVGKAMHQQTNVLGNKLDNLGDKLDDVVQAINSISISTDHQIIDTSRVQIVLSNRRDLEIDGVNIYYDLNRVYTNLSSDGSVKQSQIESASSETPSNMADEIRKLKQLLDEGLIDEEEFKAMKKKLIS